MIQPLNWPPLWVLFALILFFFLLFALEKIFPLRKPSFSLLKRLAVNLLITLLAFLTASQVIRPAVNIMLNLQNQRPMGLLHLLKLPPFFSFILAFLLLDLSFYYWHRANHKIPFLWRFHNVHHTDPDLDTSTAFRFHFMELSFSAIFRVLQIGLLGVSVWFLFIYEIVFQANTIFHHSNTHLPIGLERGLNKFLVTPRMHGIHHSQNKSETHSNFSVVFPWWDRLHQTLHLNIAQKDINIGIPAYSNPKDNQFIDLILLPFKKQRDYWKNEKGEPKAESKVFASADPTLLAE